MRRLIASASILAMLAHNAAAATLWAMPGGSDTQGDGSQAHPYATVAHAWETSQAGDTIQCSGVHHARLNFFNLQHDLTVIGCTLQPLSGQARIIGISVPGSALTLQGMTLDCAGANQGIVLYAGDGVTRVNLSGGNIIENCAQYGIMGTAAGTRASISSVGTAFTLPDSRAAYHLFGWADGSFVSSGDSLTGSAASPGNAAYLDATATAVGPTYSISDLTFTVQGAASPNASEAIDVRNVPSGTLYHVVGEMHGTEGPCRLIHVSPTPGGLDSSNTVIDHPVLYNDCKGGGNILIGQDGPDYAPPYMANYPRIISPILTGSEFSKANALHEVELGYIEGGTITDGMCNTGRYCVVAKGTHGLVQVSGATAVGMLTNAFYQKGGDQVIWDHDIAYFPADGDPAAEVGFALEDDGHGPWAGPGMTVTNSTVDFAGAGGTFIKVAPGYDLAQAANNDYWAQDGGGQWQIGTATFTTLADWQGMEPTASGADPHLTEQGLMGQ